MVGLATSAFEVARNATYAATVTVGMAVGGPSEDVQNTATTSQVNGAEIIHQAENAQFMQNMPNVFEGPQQQGLLGEMFGAVESFVNDVAEVGQQVQQAISPNALEQQNGGVLDTSLTAQETHFTHEAEIQTADIGSPGSSSGFG